VYVDGVYAGKTGGSLMDFNDVQRIEVLKGPQGTLFGRNSAAGAIAVVTNEPGAEADALGTLRFGKNNTVYFEGMGNIPLSSTSALRLAVVSNKSDGWATNASTGEKMAGSNAWGARLSYKWAPSATTKVIFTLDHQDINQAARPAFGVSPKVASGELVPYSPDPVVQARSFVDPRKSALRNDATNRETLNLDGANLRIQTDLGGVTFNSTTSWRKFNTYNRQDNDGTANVATYLDTANTENNTTYQQEFKLSAKNDTLDWISGVSFFHAKVSQRSDVNTTTDALDTLNFNTGPFAAGGIPAGVPLFPVLYGFAMGDGTPGSGGAPASGTRWSESVINGLTSRSASIYGDVIWHLNAETNATFGLRYTRDSKTVSWNVPAAISSDPTAAAIANGVLGLNNIIFANASMLAPVVPTASKNWSDTSPRFVLDHKVDGNTMVFASVSRGYQSGGYNILAPGGAFEPEKMTNVEAGFKSYFRSMGLSINGSVFNYRFKNLQGIDLVPGVPLPTYNITSSDQKAIGFDLDANFKVNDSVRLFSAVEYLDQTYDKKHFTDWTGTDINLSGQTTGAPALQMMGGVTVNWHALDGHMDLTLQANYTSKTRCNAQVIAQWGCLSGGAFNTGEARERADFRLGWASENHRFGVAVFVNNLFDKRYVGAPGGMTSSVFGTPYADITPPRHIGIEFKASM
jgi:iron complex outermembrane receptor protein